MVRLLFAFLGGLAGALIGGTVVAMVAGQVFTRMAPAAPGGWSMMAGAEFGGVVGLMLGAIAGIWLMFRDEGRFAGTALTWLWIGALLLIGCLGFVAFS